MVRIVEPSGCHAQDYALSIIHVANCKTASLQLTSSSSSLSSVATTRRGFTLAFVALAFLTLIICRPSGTLNPPPRLFHYRLLPLFLHRPLQSYRVGLNHRPARHTAHLYQPVRLNRGW